MCNKLHKPLLISIELIFHKKMKRDSVSDENRETEKSISEEGRQNEKVKRREAPSILQASEVCTTVFEDSGDHSH